MKQFLIPKLTTFISWDEITTLSDFSCRLEMEKLPATIFNAYYDQNHMHFRFVASGPKPLVFVEKNDKMEVIRSERVEIFFRSDEKMQPYYCLEIDPLGRVLDYKAKLHREFDRNWQWPEPLNIQTIIKAENYTVQGKISLSVLNKLDLIHNNQIQVGLFRAHCVQLEEKKASIKWINWVDPDIEALDFHVPSAFGILKFQ